MPELELPSGLIEYEDTGGRGPVVVLLHGVAMDASLWRNVVAELGDGYRCILPTLPLGGHRVPMHPDADLSLRGQARIVLHLMDRLGLQSVTLVGCDSGVAQVVAADDRIRRVAKLVLASQETCDNFPPGLPGRCLTAAARMPGGINALVQPLRLRLLRRTPMAWGWMSRRAVPQPILDRWMRPLLSQAPIRRDLEKYLRSSAQGKRDLSDAADRLRSFDRPVLIIWAAEDRVMPLEHGRQLWSRIRVAEMVVVADSYTLIPEDQPVEFATALREFINAPSPSAAKALDRPGTP